MAKAKAEVKVLFVQLKVDTNYEKQRDGFDPKEPVVCFEGSLTDFNGLSKEIAGFLDDGWTLLSCVSCPDYLVYNFGRQVQK